MMVERVTVLEDLEEVAALRALHRGEPPVVDEQDVEAGEFAEQADVGAVGAGQGELVKEAEVTCHENHPLDRGPVGLVSVK
jgi:hypothetical protein